MWSIRTKIHAPLLVALLLSAVFVQAPFAHAARDGVLDSDRSEGEIRISLSILPSLQINVVNQISVDIRNVMIDTEFEEYVCISGSDGGRYQLIATGQGGAFELSSSEGDRLPYNVLYNGALGGDSFDELQSGEASPIYDIATSASDCAQSPNFKVQFRSEDLRVVRSGLYTGALTLLVSPL